MTQTDVSAPDLSMRPLPPAPLPEPLRGNETNTFAHRTVVHRMPNIVRRIREENDLSEPAAAAVEALIAELPTAPIRMLTDTYAPDAAAWRAYTTLAVGHNWLTVPWFFAETYLYRRIVEAVDFFGTGTDPFRYQKEEGLRVTTGQIHARAEQIEAWLDAPGAETVDQALKAALWGNQADLSLWPAGSDEQPQHTDDASQDAHLLADDADAVARYLAAHPGARVDVIADNAGFELVGDLALIDVLLSSERAREVHLHLKIHPTFVSDALIKDVEGTIDELARSTDAATARFGERLRGHVEAGRLLLQDDAYWTSPLPGWAMPDRVIALLAPSDLIISKGDANYRRWLGDSHWPFTTPFAEAVRYYPAPLVALRTVKAEVAVGLPEGRADELDREDPHWKTNGHWGVVQFADVTARSRRNGH